MPTGYNSSDSTPTVASRAPPGSLAAQNEYVDEKYPLLAYRVSKSEELARRPTIICGTIHAPAGRSSAQLQTLALCVCVGWASNIIQGMFKAESGAEMIELSAQYGPGQANMEARGLLPQDVVGHMFSFRAFGYMLGSVLGGFYLRYFKTHESVALLVAYLGCACGNLYIANGHELNTLFATRHIQGLCLGVLETMAVSMFCRTLPSDGAGTALQMFHFMFTVGASMMPVTANIVATHRHSKYHHEQHPTNLAVTFLVVAGVGLMLAIGPLLLSCREVVPSVQSKAETAARQLPRRIVVAAAAVTAVGTAMETMLGNFIYVYGVEMYGMSNVDARSLNALSWGCQGMGRVLGILLSSQGLPPGKIFRGLVLPLGVISSTFLMLFPERQAVGWACIPLFGVSMGPLMACVQGEAAAAGDFTGFAVTLMVVVQASCEMVVPLVAVHLMRPDTHGTIFHVVFAGVLTYVAIYLHVFRPPPRAKGMLVKEAPGWRCSPFASVSDHRL